MFELNFVSLRLFELYYAIRVSFAMSELRFTVSKLSYAMFELSYTMFEPCNRVKLCSVRNKICFV